MSASSRRSKARNCFRNRPAAWTAARALAPVARQQHPRVLHRRAHARVIPVPEMRAATACVVLVSLAHCRDGEVAVQADGVASFKTNWPVALDG